MSKVEIERISETGPTIDSIEEENSPLTRKVASGSRKKPLRFLERWGDAVCALGLVGIEFDWKRLPDKVARRKHRRANLDFGCWATRAGMDKTPHANSQKIGTQRMLCRKRYL